MIKTQSKSKVFDGRSGNSEVLTRDTWRGEAPIVSRGRNEVFPRRSSIEPRFLSTPEVPTPAETIWSKYVDLFVENIEKSGKIAPPVEKRNEKIGRKKFAK